jgi:hypothetical protein
LADGFLVDHLNASGIQRSEHTHQRVDIAAHHTSARLHALYGGNRNSREFGQLALVNSK